MTASVEEWKRRYETARLAHEEARAEIERLKAERDAWYMRALKAEDNNERLRALIPAHIVREFMAHRHFWAAHEIDIVARKDAKEYRLEGDWLKDACHALEPKP